VLYNMGLGVAGPTQGFGPARETVGKILRYSVPPGYRRQQPARRPKLDAWVGTIYQILERDNAEGSKQPHTTKPRECFRWFRA